MRRTLPILLTLSTAFLGCKAKELYDQAKIAKDLSKSGSTRELLEKTAQDKYEPPKDGRLTEAQVQMYLKVREHEKAIAQVAKDQLKQHADAAKKDGDKSIAGMMDGFKALGSAADLMTADIRAAKDLHYNTQEYLWVKGQILAASTSVMTEKLTQAASASMDSVYASMKKQYDEAKDEQTKKIYADSLAAYDQQKKEMAQSKEKEDPALAYNRQLLSKHEDALKAWTTEMSKYEDKPGETQKSMDQWQKDMDKATADAKKTQ
jgi:hypothetical protein